MPSLHLDRVLNVEDAIAMNRRLHFVVDAKILSPFGVRNISGYVDIALIFEMSHVKQQVDNEVTSPLSDKLEKAKKYSFSS